MKLHKSIKIESELIKAIQRKAINENRSFNNMVEVLLERQFTKICDHEFTIANTTQILGSGGKSITSPQYAICQKCGFKPVAV